MRIPRVSRLKNIDFFLEVKEIDELHNVEYFFIIWSSIRLAIN
jgi:hypothetical protein